MASRREFHITGAVFAILLLASIGLAAGNLWAKSPSPLGDDQKPTDIETRVTPPDPSNFQIVSHLNSLDLSWDGQQQGIVFELQRGTTVLDAAVAQESYTDTGLDCGTSYTYRIRAWGDGSDPWLGSSGWVSATGTTSDCPTPPAPTGVSATATGTTSIRESWASQSGISQFKLAWGSSTAYPSASSTSRTVTGLSPCRTYTFSLKAEGDGITSEGWSSSSAVSEDTDCPPPPDPPAGLTNSAGDGTVTLRWDTADDAHEYFVYQLVGSTPTKLPFYDSVSGTTYTLNGSATDITLTGTSATVAGLTNTLTYHYRVIASNVGGESSPSQTSRTLPLVAPDELIATPLAMRTVELQWNKPNNPSTTNYTVQHREFLLTTADTDHLAVTVAPMSGAGPVPAPTPSIPGSPSVLIQGLSSYFAGGITTDDFELRAFNLAPSNEYIVKVSTNSVNLGFNNTCVDKEHFLTFTVPVASTTYTGWRTLYACGPTEGVVTVELQEGTWTLWADITIPNRVDERQIELEDFLSDRDLDEFRVKASIPPSNPKHSDSIAVIDNAILVADGSPGGGQAHIRWDLPPDAGGAYRLRYAELLDDYNDNRHTQDFWRPVKISERLSTPWTYSTNDTISGLTSGSIYALQLIYLTSTGQRVYSGRDSYVWVSDEPPKSRVATYPFYGHHEDNEYRYRICSDTFFPEDAKKQADWTALIEYAFEQWEIYTNGLVTTTVERHEHTGQLIECPDPTEDDWWWLPYPHTMYQVLVVDSNGVNEVMMVDPDTDGHLISDVYRLCITNAPACVISEGYQHADSTRKIQDVDVLFSLTTFDAYNPRIPEETTFNTCYPAGVYRPYRTALHEGGHALGLSDASIFEVIWDLIWGNNRWNVYKVSHPTIPDSVMNYNRYLIDEYDRERYGGSDRIATEQDCAPHPFDMMAISALYQSQ